MENRGHHIKCIKGRHAHVYITITYKIIYIYIHALARQTLCPKTPATKNQAASVEEKFLEFANQYFRLSDFRVFSFALSNDMCKTTEVQTLSFRTASLYFPIGALGSRFLVFRCRSINGGVRPEPQWFRRKIGPASQHISRLTDAPTVLVSQCSM